MRVRELVEGASPLSVDVHRPIEAVEAVVDRAEAYTHGRRVCRGEQWELELRECLVPV